MISNTNRADAADNPPFLKIIGYFLFSFPYGKKVQSSLNSSLNMTPFSGVLKSYCPYFSNPEPNHRGISNRSKILCKVFTEASLELRLAIF